VKCLGCNTRQTVALDVVRRPKATPIHELERYMRCKDCSQVRGYPYKRSHLVALRPTKISTSDPSGRKRHCLSRMQCGWGCHRHALPWRTLHSHKTGVRMSDRRLDRHKRAEIEIALLQRSGRRREAARPRQDLRPLVRDECRDVLTRLRATPELMKHFRLRRWRML
jgi:predicted nucleic acid-binding Zn ribbon protein